MEKLYRYGILTLATLMMACAPQAAESHDDEEHHHHEGESNHVELSQKQLNTVGIELGNIRQIELGNGLRVTGTIEVNPSASAEVAPMLPGIVVAINAVEGQTITQGTPIAYIENADIIETQQQYLEALDEAALAKSEYERQKALNEQGAGVLKNLQQAETTYNIANIRVEGLVSRLKVADISPAAVTEGKFVTRVPVKAPISGTITKINAVVGSYADMSTPLLTIINNQGIYASLRVYEQDVERLRVGQNVEIRPTNAEGAPIAGVIEKINQTINPETKAMSVRVRITQGKAPMLLSGMAINALINTGTQLVMALPEGAFVSSGGKSYVFLEKGSEKENGQRMYHFDKVEVLPDATDLGMTSFTFVDQVEVKPTTRFVISNAFYLGSATSDHGEHNH